MPIFKKEKDETVSDQERKELNEVKKRLGRVERRLGFIETQLGVFEPGREQNHADSR